MLSKTLKQVLNKKDVFKWSVVIVIGFGTVAMFNLPYLYLSFYTTIKSVTNLDDLQFGLAISVYGWVSLVSYMIGGFISDFVKPKYIMTFSLLATGAIGFWFSTLPNFGELMVIYALWGCTTILTFWSASIKVVKDLGNEAEQGKLFDFKGSFEGVGGLILSLLGTLFLFVFDELVGFTWTIDVSSVICIAMGVILFFMLIKLEHKKTARTKISIKEIISIFKNPRVYLCALIIMGIYLPMRSLTYFQNILVDVGIVGSLASAIGAIRTYGIKLVAAPVAGYVGDKTKNITLLTLIGTSIVFVLLIVQAFIPVQTNMMTLIIILMFIITIIVYGLNYPVFGIMTEAKLDQKTIGIATGLIFVIGYSPDAWYYIMGGAILNSYPDNGYFILFMISALFVLLSMASGITLYLVIRHDKKIAKNKFSAQPMPIILPIANESVLPEEML